MSQFYFNPNQQSSLNTQSSFQPGTSNQQHHSSHQGGSRARRATRYSSSQNSHKQFKSHRFQKDIAEVTYLATLRKDFEAARSFDLEDDELFCPWHLLTEDDLQSIHSSSSDRSSLSSESPDSSPLPHQLQPTAGFSFISTSVSSFQQGTTGQLKIHQPSAQRARNAIPIVDPNSRTTSPPQSISPARQIQKQYASRRW